MATEAGPGKLRAREQTLKELESGMAAWEQGQALFCPQPATLQSLVLQ